eukprot:g15951.t1
MGRVGAVSVLALLAVPRTASACVELQGIVPGGGDGLLDLEFLLSTESLGNHLAPFDSLANPLAVEAASGCTGLFETPIGLRFATVVDLTDFSVANMFQPNGVALDAFGDKETSDARRRCPPADGDEGGEELFDMHLKVALQYAFGYSRVQHVPWCAEQISERMELIGCPLSLLEVAEGEPEPSTDTPWGLAKAYVDEVWSSVENDGWNADGGMGGKEYNLVPFTGDFSYEDCAGNKWNGYTPKNTPYKFKHKKRWQPLLESDGIGYITTQEHVTPHIGVTARFLGFRTCKDEDEWGSRKLNKPPYRRRHEEVAREVLEASKLAASNTTKEFAISFFDSKISSLTPLLATYFLQRPDTLSVLDFMDIFTKSQLAMYNAVVLVWREKVRHDAPRPPSVIRRVIGDEIVEAYAGPDNGVQNITASEWEPYIRTMPHSEYPSASSCICEAFVGAMKLWTGTDDLDPPLEYPAPELGEPMLTFTSWSEISEMCGESRLWAGLHFEGAIPAGVELCGGDRMAKSIAGSIDGLIAGDETAAVLYRGYRELMLRPL